MTRDGTFLIEHGEVVGPGQELPLHAVDPRGALEHDDVGRETELASEFFFSACRVPALKVEAFHFTGRQRPLTPASATAARSPLR